MNLSTISAPIIGAIIGYATNYIAIKMMFRPLKPIKLGKFTLPFTPGIIPKEKPRIAHAIGEVINNSLLSKDIIEETLLSDEMKGKVSEATHEFLKQLTKDERTLHEVITSFVHEEQVKLYKAKAVDYVALRIDQQLKENPVGEFIAAEVIKSVKENLKGGFLGLIAHDNLLQPIGVKIQQGIDEYLEENTVTLVVPPITKECDKLLDYHINDLAELMTSYETSITAHVLKLYEEIITSKLEPMFQSFNIAGIVENRINAMNTKELEVLLLSIMKKELNAVINLGAVIGFLLGLFNLFF